MDPNEASRLLHEMSEDMDGDEELRLGPGGRAQCAEQPLPGWAPGLEIANPAAKRHERSNPFVQDLQLDL